MTDPEDFAHMKTRKASRILPGKKDMLPRSKGKARGRLAEEREEWGEEPPSYEPEPSENKDAPPSIVNTEDPIRVLKIGSNFYIIDEGLAPEFDIEVNGRQLVVFSRFPNTHKHGSFELMMAAVNNRTKPKKPAPKKR